MPSSTPLWIKSPLAILADGDASGGVVVSAGTIVELVPAGGSPSIECATFDASRHVVLPGLINTHHHFYQTLTRAHPAAINKELFDWLTALYPIWAKMGPEEIHVSAQVGLAELEQPREGRGDFHERHL